MLGPLTIRGWQWILMFMGLPGLLVGLLFLTVKEPTRLAPAADAQQVPRDAGVGRRILTFMGLDALRAINAKPRVYYPLFGALALSAVEVFGLQFWRVPFMIRTFGWDERQIGAALGITMLVGSLSGLLLGSVLVEWLAKRHKDANVRAAAICAAGTTVSSIAAILMPTAWGLDDPVRHFGHVRAGRRCSAKRRCAARCAQRYARAGDGVLPVHVHLLRRDGQLCGGPACRMW